MTQALCLFCGEIKHGALCHCWKCKNGPTGNEELDCVFSDHLMSIDTMRDLGTIIKTINRETVDIEFRFGVFTKYISINMPNVLTVEPNSECESIINAIYEKLNLPKTEWKPGYRNNGNNDKSEPSGRPWGCMLIIALIVGIVAWRIISKYF
jgi:hypothetical protein